LSTYNNKQATLVAGVDLKAGCTDAFQCKL